MKLKTAFSFCFILCLISSCSTPLPATASADTPVASPTSIPATPMPPAIQPFAEVYGGDLSQYDLGTELIRTLIFDTTNRWSAKDQEIAPTPQTVASESLAEGKVQYEYWFTGYGALSWSIPYLAGVLALGWQINPKLSKEEILHLIYTSAAAIGDGQKVIDPVSFSQLVKTTTRD